MPNRLFSVLAALTLVAAGAAWSAAAGSHSVEVNLLSATSVNGTEIPAGTYRFSWMGDAHTVDVTIERAGRVVAKTEATLEQRPDAAPEKQVVTRTSKAGTSSLEELRFRGKTTALVFSAS